MIGAANILELWRIPTNKLFFRTSRFIEGPRRIPQIICFCKEIQTATSEKIVNGVSNIESIGAFQKLPMVMPSTDILHSALRKARKVSPTKGIPNIAKRERNRGAKQLDALMKELAIPLRMYTEQFPNKSHLHPYERSLIELTLGDGNYEVVLEKVNSLRKKVTSVGKEHASLCAKSLTKKEAEERLNEALRAMPVVDLETPTLSLVGAPNVGKSSLVRILSSGKPEVTDTPGVLKRLDDARNNLEKLTLAVLTHLPTAVLYVHDLTGECGTSVSDQFKTYAEIKERFSNHIWLDVISKSDLLQESPSAFITEDLATDLPDLARYRMFGPEGAIRVSVKTEFGLDQLKQKIHHLLISQSEKIKSQITNADSTAIPT
ncbi:Nucleolar GTP-binding protein 1 [Bienertia sinuspersici]